MNGESFPQSPRIFAIMTDTGFNKAFYQQLFSGDQLFFLPTEEPLPQKNDTEATEELPVAELVETPDVQSVVEEITPEIESVSTKTESGSTESGSETVEPTDTETAVIPEPTVEIPEIPAFRQQVLILVDRPSEQDLALLENILKSVQLSLDTVDLLDIQTVPAEHYRALLTNKFVHHIISFHVPLKKVGLELFLNPYQITPRENINFLLVDSLESLHDDKTKKRALWMALKQLFGL